MHFERQIFDEHVTVGRHQRDVVEMNHVVFVDDSSGTRDQWTSGHFTFTCFVKDLRLGYRNSRQTTWAVAPLIVLNCK
jgi:hypothetical protein